MVTKNKLAVIFGITLLLGLSLADGTVAPNATTVKAITSPSPTIDSEIANFN